MPQRRSTRVDLKSASPQMLATLCLILIELIRTCLHEVIRLASAAHGLKFKQQLIKQIKDGAIVGLPIDQEADALTIAIKIVDNIARFRDDGGCDLEG